MTDASSNVASTEDAGTAFSCASCRTTLPLMTPGEGETTASWVCVQCGTESAGLLDEQADEQIAHNVRPAAIHFDRASLAAPQKELLDYVSQLESPNLQREERRDAVRRTLNQTVAIQPIDEKYRPVGDPFLAISCDVSRQGIGLIHSEPIETGPLALELTTAVGKRLQVVMQVNRKREIDGFHEAAGPMVTKMGVDG